MCIQKLTTMQSLLLLNDCSFKVNDSAICSSGITYYKCHLCGLAVPVGLLRAGQVRSILAIKQCSVNTASLEKAFCTGGDAIFCALTPRSPWHFSTVGADCSQLLFNLLPIFICYAGLGVLRSILTFHRPAERPSF